MLQDLTELDGSHQQGRGTKSTVQDGNGNILHRLLYCLSFLLRQHLRGSDHHHLPGAGRGGAAGRRDRQEPSRVREDFQCFEPQILQKACIDFSIQARPLERYMPKERDSFKYKLWRVVVSRPFEYFIMLLIVLNTLLLMMKVE